MATHYVIPAKTSRKEDGFSQMIHEAAEHFQGRNINIFGGISEIFSDDVLFEEYCDKMIAGCDSQDEESLRQMMANCRFVTLHESLEGIQPIASLRAPTIKALWARNPVPRVFPTEVTRTPRFEVSFLKPYLLEADGTKHYLPEALTANSSAYKAVKGRKLYSGGIRIATFNPGSGNVAGTGAGFSFITTVEPGVTAVSGVDKIDNDFMITHVLVSSINSVGVAGAAQVQTLRLPKPVRQGTNGSFSESFSFYDARDLDSDGVTPLAGATLYSDRFFGFLNQQTCILNLTSARTAETNNKIVGVKVDGKFSVEMHNHSASISFEMDNRPVAIGAGDHLSAPITSEFMQDLMAMYQIDGAVKITDIMTATYERMLELEMNSFIEGVYDGQVDKADLTREFDCVPPTTYSGTPRGWRDMIQDTIQHLATDIRQRRNFSGGRFVIVGNELDVQLIPNVQWTFTPGGGGTERGGVDVDYIVGAVGGGSMRFDIVGTANMAKGTIWVFFVSSNPDEITMKYFPYVYQLERTGYSDPNHPNVPAIVMSKRHTLQNFIAAVGKVTVLGNTGNFGGSSS